MARVRCNCENILSNHSDNESDTLEVYSKKQVDDILKNRPDMKFWDFSTDYEYPGYDIWQCPLCRRIICFKDGNNNASHVYKPAKNKPIATETSFERFEEVLAFSNKTIFDYTEKDVHNETTLADFLKQVELPYRYFISNDRRIIYCISQKNKQDSFVYEIEP